MKSKKQARAKRLTESDFLSEIGELVSDVLWSEIRLSKKEAILISIQRKIGRRIMDTLPPGTVLMG